MGPLADIVPGPASTPVERVAQASQLGQHPQSTSGGPGLARLWGAARRLFQVRGRVAGRPGRNRGGGQQLPVGTRESHPHAAGTRPGDPPAAEPLAFTAVFTRRIPHQPPATHSVVGR